MMKYYVDGVEITEQEAIQIEKRNQEVLDRVRTGADMLELIKCKFVVKIEREKLPC